MTNTAKNATRENARRSIFQTGALALLTTVLIALFVIAPAQAASQAASHARSQKIRGATTVAQADESKSASTPAASEAAPATAEVAAATPSPSPAPTPAAQAAAPSPSPAPAATPVKAAKLDDPLTLDLRKHCERHYAGQIQGAARLACASSGPDFARLGKDLIQTRCRLTYGEEPQMVMACLVGASIADDLQAGREDFKKKLQLCAENYPMHNEIDAFLMESCLTGIHMPDLMMKTDGKARFEACEQITPERSFIGPCAVGLSLALEPTASVAPAQQNKMCDQYFNLRQFHKGYRACLNARSLTTELPSTYADALKGCSNILSEANNDTERAACLVGISIYKHLMRQDDVAKRFEKCGANKVTYEDRDFLACLAAASLLDFTDKGGAQTGCKEVFKDARSRGRGDCVNALNLF